MVSFQHAFYIISKFALQRGVLVAQFDNTVHVINDFKQLSNGDIILMRQRNVVVGVCHAKNEAYNRLILDIKTKNKGYEKILSMYVMLKTAMKLRAYWKDYKDFIMYVTILGFGENKINKTIQFTSFEEVTTLIKEDLHLLLKPTPYNVCHKGKVTACNAHGGKYEPKNKNCKTGMNKSHNPIIYDEHDTYDENLVKIQREVEKKHANQTEIEKLENIERQKQKKEEKRKQIQARTFEKEKKKQNEEEEKEEKKQEEENNKNPRVLYEERDRWSRKSKKTNNTTRYINSIISNTDTYGEYTSIVNDDYYAEVYINDDYQLLYTILLIFKAQLPNIPYKLFKQVNVNKWLLIICIIGKTKCSFDEVFEINELNLKKITGIIETCHKHNLTHGHISLRNYIIKDKTKTPILTCFDNAKLYTRLNDLDWHCLYTQLREDIYENRHFHEINNLIQLSNILVTKFNSNDTCVLDTSLLNELKKVEEMTHALKKIK